MPFGDAMDDQLRKIDILRERFDITYEEADAALRASGGEVVPALMLIEKKQQPETNLVGIAAHIADEARKVIAKGPIRKVSIKIGDRVLKEIPVALSAGAALAVALAAVFVTKLVIEANRCEDDDVCN
jgi:hypothetical protein